MFLQRVNGYRSRLLLVSAVATLCLSQSAAAQQFHSAFEQWNVYTLRDAGSILCYVTAAPTEKAGNFKKRGEPYIIVTHRDTLLDEVSVASGYRYKNFSSVELGVDKTPPMLFFTTPEYPRIAWAKSAPEDVQLVEQMKKGSKLSVKGTSVKDTYSLDTYSLNGFLPAYQQMKALCKSPNAAIPEQKSPNTQR